MLSLVSLTAAVSPTATALRAAGVPLTDADEHTATERLATAGSLKLALVMELCAVDLATAQDLLAAHGDSVKKAIAHGIRSE